MADLDQKMDALSEAKVMAEKVLDSIECGEISEKESDVNANIQDAIDFAEAMIRDLKAVQS